MNRFERYLLRNMLAGVGTVLLVMSALVIFVNLLSQLEDLHDTGFSAGQLLFYVSLRLPAFLFQTIPIAALIGTLLGVGSLAVQRELIAMQVLGLSIWRMARAAMLAALLIGAGAWVLGDVIGPRADAMARQMRDAQRLGGVGALLANQVWLRDGVYFIRVDRLVSPRLLRGVEVMEFGEEGRLRQSYAHPGRWWNRMVGCCLMDKAPVSRERAPSFSSRPSSSGRCGSNPRWWKCWRSSRKP